MISIYRIIINARLNMIKRLDISMLIENAHKAEGHRSFTLQLPLSLLSGCCVNTVASVTKPVGTCLAGDPARDSNC